LPHVLPHILPPELLCHSRRLLVTLKETNAAAFAALLETDLEGLLPLVYTPTIGEACLAWGSLLPRPTGLYITSADRCGWDLLIYC
jgi:malic enzyme